VNLFHVPNVSTTFVKIFTTSLHNNANSGLEIYFSREDFLIIVFFAVRTWQLFCRHRVRWARVFNKINSQDKVLISWCSVGLGKIYSAQESVFLLWREVVVPLLSLRRSPRSSSSQHLISRRR
jgi:hypothetical protein